MGDVIKLKVQDLEILLNILKENNISMKVHRMVRNYGESVRL